VQIVILGAGQVGASVAEALVSEANDITVVDIDTHHLALLQDRLDLRTVVGNAASPSTLREAGAEDADLLIAVTQSDQTNLCACRIAKTLFNIRTRIARLRSLDFVEHPELLDGNNFAVDFSICPEQEVTDDLVRLLAFPDALQVLQFAGGAVSLVAVRARPGGLLIDKPIHDMRKHLPKGVDARIAAIFRDYQHIAINGDTVIRAGDEVFVLAPSQHIRQVFAELRRMEKPVRHVMIAGGGNIGFRFAKAIEASYDVKLIERNEARGRYVATQLNRTLVLAGDATDEKLMGSEGIEEMDFFLALTNDDENNIMAALMAKRLGAKRVLALINRRAYVDLVQGGEIDIAISPAQLSIGTLPTHVRRGDVARVHSLRRGAAEALELVAHGDPSTSKVVGRRVDEIDLPEGATIGAMVRAAHASMIVYEQGLAVEKQLQQVLIAHHDVRIESGDHVIVFCVSKRLVTKVEKLFQVSVGFL
jgi:trk system potassium uptake protein